MSIVDIKCLEKLAGQNINGVPIKAVFFKRYASVKKAISILRQKYLFPEDLFEKIENELNEKGYYLLIIQGSYYGNEFIDINYIFIEQKKIKTL